MIADILGVQKSTAKNVVNLNEKLKVKTSRKRVPLGVAREVLHLCGDSLVSLPLQRHTLDANVDKRPASKWVFSRVRNSAHPSQTLHLHQWMPKVETIEFTKESSNLPRHPGIEDQAVSGEAKDIIASSTTAPEGEKTSSCPNTSEANESVIEGVVAEGGGNSLITTKIPESTTISETANKTHDTEPPSSKDAAAATNINNNHRKIALTVPTICCQHTAKEDYPASAYNKKPHVARYTNSLYQKLLANLNPNWTRWETDYLFSLCCQYDLRFFIIHDRYSPTTEIIDHISQRKIGTTAKKDALSMGSSTKYFSSVYSHLASLSLEALESLLAQTKSVNPRSITQLKDRYYSIARRLVEHEYHKKIEALEARFASLTTSVSQEHVESLGQQRAQLLAETRAELSRHPLVKYHYDQTLDLQRRTYLEQQYQITSTAQREQRELERSLVSQVVKTELAAKKTITSSSALARKDDITTKRKKSGSANIAPQAHTTNNQELQVSASSPTATATDGTIPIELFQHQLLYGRKPGPILASQIMQQFGAPLLLQPSAPVPSTATPLNAADKNSLSTSGNNSQNSSITNAPTSNIKNWQYGSATTPTPALLRKHEAKIQAELEILGFGNNSNCPLWPSYNDRDMIEAFNALRIDVATMINYNVKVEQLTKEKAIWKSKIAQLKDETNNAVNASTMSHSLSNRGFGGNNTSHIIEPGGSASANTKKNHGRPASTATAMSERSVKKPRRSSKRSSTGNTIPTASTPILQPK